MAQESPDIPHNMRKIYRRFERWRSAHTARLPIPERLWAVAVELAREHGVSVPRRLCIWSMAEAADGSGAPSGEVSGMKTSAAGTRHAQSTAPSVFVEREDH